MRSSSTGLAASVLKMFRPLPVLFAEVERIGPQGVPYALLRIPAPASDLREGQTEGPARPGHCRLTLVNLDDRRRPPLRRPPFDILLHRHTQ